MQSTSVVYEECKDPGQCLMKIFSRWYSSSWNINFPWCQGLSLDTVFCSQFIMPYGDWGVSLSPWEEDVWRFLECCRGRDGSNWSEACTLLLRLLKCHLLTPLKEVVSNLPFFLKNIFEMLMLPPDTSFFLIVSPLCVLESHFSVMYKKEEVQLFVSKPMVVVCKWHEDLLPCPL